MSKFFDKFKNNIKKLEDSINDYTDNTKSTSNPALSYVEWATKLLEEGNDESAIEKLETATQMAVKSPEACVNLALAYIKHNK